MDVELKIKRIAELIRDSRHMIAFTGAGHSTASGIPDFRSPDSGLWQHDNPMLVASSWAFRLNPRTFYDWIRPLVPTMLNAEPNAAHIALADLEEMGYLKTVITQNIDSLHQQAGSGRVLELHGHMRQATCTRCYEVTPIEPVVEQFLTNRRVPRCHCGGTLKPNVILFGEQLPIKIYNQAVAEARQCDLILVAGSSLEVYPAADIPVIAADRGARSVIINLEPTDFDTRADVVLHGDVTEILPWVVNRIRAMKAD